MSAPVVMIGLDAAELALIERHRAVLPALDGVLARGVVGRLASTADALPGSVWPTFASGTLPGVHGVYHHLQWDPATMRIRRVTHDWLPYEPFWYGLERRGLDVAALDVPMTFPPRRASGVEILNWGSHDQLGAFAAHPRELGSEIRRRFGARHPMGYEIPVTKTPGELARIRGDLIAGARRKGELACWLYARQPWDLFLTVFGETHRGGHILWPDRDAADTATAVTQAALAPVVDVYRAVDGALASLLTAAAARGATVIVFALHGMGPNTSQEHFLPQVMDRVNATFATRTGAARGNGGDPIPARSRGLVRLLRERVPARLQNAVAQAVPVAVRDAVVSRQITGGHAWPRTPGLALLADLNGYLRCNVRGREAEGMLAAADVHAYRDWLRTCLESLRIAPSGDPLVGDVLAAGDAFPGPRSALLPDAVVRWTGAPPARRVTSAVLGDVVAEIATGRGGNHRFSGFCAVLPGRGATTLPPLPDHIAGLAAFAAALLENSPPRLAR